MSVPVFYMGQMVADSQAYSPSAAKPAQVVADWRHHKLPIQLFKFDPLTRDDIALAHKRQFVDDVLNCVRSNGFGNTSAEVAASLPYTTGAMTAAVFEAYARGSVACAPVSGFHHAGYDFAGGFCTFNGLMIAAITLRNVMNRDLHIGILDLDAHMGNGTEDIARKLNTRWLRHHSLGAMALSSDDADAYLRTLPGIMDMYAGCDLLIYQAGADCHINDPLGGVFTTEQMAKRDRIVFQYCKDMGIPVAWVLAGGYQRDEQGTIEPVLALHRQTMDICAQIYGA
jgi:acetoin utilization deacetylase AcuC-like enzyme